MAILNYTTSVESEKTISEIQKCLVKHGATKIVTDYHEGLPSGVTFCLVITKSGTTLYKEIQGNGMKLLRSNN